MKLDHACRIVRCLGPVAAVGLVLAAGVAAGQNAPAAPQQALAARLDQIKAQLFEMSDWMYRNPEPGYKEFKAIEKMLEPLRAAGFTSKAGLAGLPAEEIPPPTINDLNAAGVFDDVDFVLEFHSSESTARADGGIGSCCSIPINAVRYTFLGRSVSANVPTKNLKPVKEQGSSLEAILQFFQNVKQVRQQVKPEAIIQGVIADGGEAPNVIPRKTVADFFIRYPVDRPYVDQVTEAVNAAARQAADATGTQVQIDLYGKFYVGISLSALEERAFAYEKAFGAAGVKEEKGRPQGGMISQWVPGVSLHIQTSVGIPGHSLEMADASIAPLAHNGLLVAAKTLAAVGYDLVSDATLRQKAVEEHERWREELRARGWLEPVRRPGRTDAVTNPPAR